MGKRDLGIRGPACNVREFEGGLRRALRIASKLIWLSYCSGKAPFCRYNFRDTGVA